MRAGGWADGRGRRTGGRTVGREWKRLSQAWPCASHRTLASKDICNEKRQKLLEEHEAWGHRLFRLGLCLSPSLSVPVGPRRSLRRHT